MKLLVVLVRLGRLDGVLNGVLRLGIFRVRE